MHGMHYYWQVIEKYKLGNPKNFHYLNQSKCYKLDGIDDADEYIATRRAMDIVGISEEEQVCIVHYWSDEYLISWSFIYIIYFVFRRQYLELWLQFFILEILILQRVKR